MSPPESRIPTKDLANILRPSHGYKLHKTRQTASLKRSKALYAMSCPACLCPELQILTTGGTRTRDAYSLLANTTMLITCVPTKSLLDGHGHDHAIHCMHSPSSRSAVKTPGSWRHTYGFIESRIIIIVVIMIITIFILIIITIIITDMTHLRQSAPAPSS